MTDNKLLVSVKYTVKPGMRDEFFRKVFDQGIISDSKAEAGNIKYEYTASLESDDVLCLIELWDSHESFILHGKTPHYQKLQALKQQYVAQVSVEKYSVSDRLMRLGRLAAYVNG